MKTLKRTIAIGLFLLLLGGCATLPTGPSVMVLPPPNKSLDQFQADDTFCRQWAARQIGLSPQDTLNQNVATGALIGTAIGAGLGAAIGATSADAGAGAAIGGGTGLLLGSASGADAGQVYGYEAQRRYDIKYMQCMYAKGNQIPGVRTRSTQTTPPPPPPDFTATPQGYPSGEWVTVPGQQVNGIWVPAHKAWAPLKQTSPVQKLK